MLHAGSIAGHTSLVPFSVANKRTKSRGAVAGPGYMRTAQISTCPMPSLVVYNENS